jgi:hypothetical protein
MGAGTFLVLPFFAPFNDDESEPDVDTPGGAGNAPWAMAGRGLGGSARTLSAESSELASSARRALLPVGAKGKRRDVDAVDDVDAMLETVPVLDAFSSRTEAPGADGPTLHVPKLGRGETGELERVGEEAEADAVDVDDGALLCDATPRG